MALSPLQERARAAFVDWYENWYPGRTPFYLGGYAGSGKTTIAKVLVEDIKGPVVFCAYTGKAAHVLATKGCAGARTIHSLIYLQAGQVTEAQIEQQREQLVKARAAVPIDQVECDRLAAQLASMELAAKRGGPRFILNPASAAAYADLIVVDECSMVDERTGRDLESFNRPILVLGDPAQLPPVMGAGYFTGREPDFLLDEVHRQAQDSPILWLATRIRQRDAMPSYGRHGDALEILSFRDDGREAAAMRADQVLVGRNKTRHSSNHKIRRLRGLGEGGCPVAGDRVICLRNDHEAGLLNGQLFDVANAMEIDAETVALELAVEGGRFDCVAWRHHFEGREDELSPFVKRDCQEFAYGYAITVHKSQGSQWPNVCVFDESSAFGRDGWRHLYTAVTRASERLTLVT